MHVHIAGTGKLAAELLAELPSLGRHPVSRWTGEPESTARSIVVHAGSGREIEAIARFCARTSSVLVELATGSSLEGTQPSFPVVLCPNTNLLMLKFMCMLERSGALFCGSQIQVTESHQASKTSVPGTAVAMAAALGVPASEITSVRDPALQARELGIPQGHLGRHAFHRITIQDGPCAITMETRMHGDAPYARGVQQIIEAIEQRPLQPRVHAINEFIENGWA